MSLEGENDRIAFRRSVERLLVGGVGLSESGIGGGAETGVDSGTFFESVEPNIPLGGIGGGGGGFWLIIAGGGDGMTVDPDSRTSELSASCVSIEGTRGRGGGDSGFGCEGGTDVIEIDGGTIAFLDSKGSLGFSELDILIGDTEGCRDDLLAACGTGGRDGFVDIELL